MDTKHTEPTDSTTHMSSIQAAIHMAYIAQQCLDGYDKAIWHALKQKVAFNKRVLQWHPGKVSYPYFSQSQLQSNLGLPDLSLGIDAKCLMCLEVSDMSDSVWNQTH